VGSCAWTRRSPSSNLGSCGEGWLHASLCYTVKSPSNVRRISITPASPHEGCSSPISLYPHSSSLPQTTTARKQGIRFFIVLRTLELQLASALLGSFDFIHRTHSSVVLAPTHRSNGAVSAALIHLPTQPQKPLPHHSGNVATSPGHHHALSDCC
jgi:hypothetical protein